MQLRFAALSVLAMFVAAPALAEAPPPGSYQNSCKNAQVQKMVGGTVKTLTASCQKENGKYVGAVMPLPCGGDIMNKTASSFASRATPTLTHLPPAATRFPARMPR